MTNSVRSRWLPIIGLFLLGFLIRALFLRYGAQVYYASAPSPYLNGDSPSYMWVFENLLNHGRYTFDFLEPDAAFGRLPGYPFFYGLHYLIFGAERAVLATACSQVLLDSLAILLVYGILRRLAPAARLAPYLGAALYAFYPFIIIWVSIIGTEVLATDISLLVLYLLAGYRPGRATLGYAVGLGVALAAAFYTREYLGVLVPIALLVLLLRQPRQAATWRTVLVTGLTFGLLYAAWPIRNYISYQRFLPVKTASAGYAYFKPDLREYRAWVQCWTNDETPWIYQVTKSTGPIAFPAGVFASPAEEAEAQQLVSLARRCGSGFWAFNANLYARPQYRDTAAMLNDSVYRRFRDRNCNEAVSAGFQKLKASYQQQHPLGYWLQVPGQNLRKAFFKSGTAAAGQAGGGGAKALLMTALFGYRTLLVLLGVAGLWLLRRRAPGLVAVTLFTGFMYLFICFGLRSLEMRYLLQADVWLLIPAALLLGGLLERLFKIAPAPEAPSVSVRR